MPGHKGKGGGILKSVYKYDVTELSATDNLAAPYGAIKKAENDLALLTGAKKSFILTGGSTLGIFAMLYAALGKGNKIIIEKSSHKSVFNALKLFNIEPVFLPQKIVNGLSEINVEDIDKLCDNGVIGALLTSPDYFGRVQKLQKAALILHKKNKLLLVDGAHGAHLKFMMPKLYSGNFADAWVGGAHKTLKTLTMGALLNVNNQSIIEKIREGLNIFSSSSPSFLIAASVEDGFKDFSEVPQETFEEFYKIRDYVVKSLKKDYCVIHSDDRLKLCIDLKNRADGLALGDFLEKRGIFPELSEGRFIIFMLSPHFSTQEADFLVKALNDYDGFTDCNQIKDDIFDINLQRKTSYLAASSDNRCEYVDLPSALNRVAAANAGLFPPCYPLITCGEVFDNRVIAALSGRNTFGVVGGKVKVLKYGNDT